MPIRDKDARRKYNQEWYEKNKERVREYRAKYYQAHKVQGQTYAKRYRENNESKSEMEHKYTLRKKHNMTPEDYEALLQQQSGVCAICGEANLNGRRLAVDHDHETGKIRGLLCVTCNVALNKLDQNRDWAKKAIEYLIQADQIPVPAVPSTVQSP